jgi:PAS domain S-box-containing protein
MDDNRKTKEQLIQELEDLGRRIAELETSENERKRAEEALSHERDRTQRYLDTVETIIVALNAEGKITSINRKGCQLFGCAEDELIGQSWFLTCLPQPDGIENVYPVFLKLIKGEIESVEYFENSIVTRSGELRQIAWHNGVLYDEHGRIIGTLSSGEDITDRKRAEETLQKEKEKFQLLVEESPLGVALINKDGVLQYLNPKFIEIFGYTLKDIPTGRDWFEKAFPDEEYRKSVISIWKKDLKESSTGESRPRIFKVRCKNGNDRWAYFRPVTMVEGGQFVTSEDITERKQMEETLRQSEEKYRNILENIEEGYYEVDLAGNFTFFNDMMCEFHGYSREELMGMNNREYTTRETAQKIFKAFHEIYNTGKPAKNLQWETIRKDGSKKYHETSASLMKDSKGKPIGFRGIVRDLTEYKQLEKERRKLEEQLQRAEKMESLGILAGGVAHDLNNVLGIIVGYSELLLYDLEASSSLRPALLNILGGSQRAAATVEDMLALARRGVSGRQVLNLNKITVDCLNSPEFNKLSSYHPSVKIKTDLEPELLNLSGSAVHLGKTLFNLVSNASEAMPNGGTLTIKTANQYLDRPDHGYDEVREGDYVVLSVSDTGEGMPAADLKHIFEPFYTKKVMGRSGTGLGLAVVWGTVKDHQGYINVQSEAGKGSTFTLYFPMTREEITAEEVTVSISEYLGKGETILVVDDIRGQRDLAESMLKILNYRVTSVESGEEAVAYLKEQKVDLVLLDMIMDPGIDGLDTYKRILEIHPRQKAIIVSGFSESERVNDAQALGAGAYVRKPYVLEKMGQAVRKELDRAP